jgi:hypothetical protein
VKTASAVKASEPVIDRVKRPEDPIWHPYNCEHEIIIGLGDPDCPRISSGCNHPALKRPLLIKTMIRRKLCRALNNMEAGKQ